MMKVIKLNKILVLSSLLALSFTTHAEDFFSNLESKIQDLNSSTVHCKDFELKHHNLLQEIFKEQEKQTITKKQSLRLRLELRKYSDNCRSFRKIEQNEELQRKGLLHN